MLRGVKNYAAARRKTMPDWTKVLALHLMAQEENMDMSDPSVQRMLDDDRAQALARIRAAKQEEDNEKGE